MQFAEEMNQQEQLIDRLLLIRHKTELLCGPLTLEDMIVSANQDTSPAKWHLAHTTWFFEHFILQAFKPGYQLYNSDYASILNSYYLSVNNPLEKSKRSVLSRPATADIISYRRHVERELQKLLSDNLPKWSEVCQVLALGIAHEEQHQELLLMDIKQNFFSNPLHPLYESRQELEERGEVPLQQWIPFKEGLVEIGVYRDEKKFSFDNEKDKHKVWIDSFYLSSHLVSNQEYLGFIQDQGYQRPEFWSSDGWSWVNQNKISSPHYWIERNGEFWEFSHYGVNPLNLDAPVAHISFYEASALAKFMKARLPTEAEWEMASQFEPVRGQFLEQDSYLPDAAPTNYEHFSQMHGTLWEWTSSHYAPYPRYQAYEGGLNEYNEKFMNQQYVLRGGSCITPFNHYRPTYRNYYYPQMRWQFCGIRLAKDNI